MERHEKKLAQRYQQQAYSHQYWNWKQFRIAETNIDFYVKKVSLAGCITEADFMMSL